MRLRAVTLAVVLAALPAAGRSQEPEPAARRGPGPLRALRSLPGDEGTVATLDSLFTDVSRLLAGADPLQAETLRKAIVMKDRELGLLRRLLAGTRKGLAVQVPRSVSEVHLQVDAGGDRRGRLKELDRELERLRARVRYARETGRDLETAEAGSGTAEITPRGEALLALDVEVPPPPESRAGAPERVRRAADPAGLGRALYRMGDAQGALNAFGRVPEGRRTAEIWYRMGRACERLDLPGKAQGYYEKAIEKDPEGMWGRNARLQLELARMVQEAGGGSGGKQDKEKP